MSMLTAGCLNCYSPLMKCQEDQGLSALHSGSSTSLHWSYENH